MKTHQNKTTPITYKDKLNLKQYKDILIENNFVDPKLKTIKLLDASEKPFFSFLLNTQNSLREYLYLYLPNQEHAGFCLFVRQKGNYFNSQQVLCSFKTLNEFKQHVIEKIPKLVKKTLGQTLLKLGLILPTTKERSEGKNKSYFPIFYKQLNRDIEYEFKFDFLNQKAILRQISPDSTNDTLLFKGIKDSENDGAIKFKNWWEKYGEQNKVLKDIIVKNNAEQLITKKIKHNGNT